MIRNLSDKNVTVSLGEKEGKRISITPGLKLYHVSKYSGLNELKPMFKSVRDKILYPSQRIYFCRNYPINPSGTPWNKKGYVYEYTPTSTQNLYRDEEYGADHGPCFLETNSSVTVKDVTAEMIRNYDSIRSKYSR